MAAHAISRLNRAYALLLGKYELIEREIEHVNGIDNQVIQTPLNSDRIAH
jgi:hypothetical protein